MADIFVTKPSLPPLEKLIPFLEKIWESQILTNSGPFHAQLEAALCEYLDVKHLSLVANATIGLIVSLKALNITREVITTPYSFVATAHSLLWNSIKPIFVDIDKNTFNLDPNKIEAAITENTTAILAVHCYGNPCAVEQIAKIANRYNLKVVYDAAHAFGVKRNGTSILNHGDLSVLSFHATKVFNTFEGGAIISPNSAIKDKVDKLKNFGFTGEISVEDVGINGKMSEFNSAFGLIQLESIDKEIQKRKEVAEIYTAALSKVPGISIFKFAEDSTNNYSYFPILVNEKSRRTRDALYLRLRENGIYSRRYFYPLITEFPMYKMLLTQENDISVAKSIADQVLCLPIYAGLNPNEINKIVEIISYNCSN